MNETVVESLSGCPIKHFASLTNYTVANVGIGNVRPETSKHPRARDSQCTTRIVVALKIQPPKSILLRVRVRF